MSESYTGKINRKLQKKRRIINAAAGREPADLVLKNATYVNVFSNELCHADIAVAEGLIVGMGEYSGETEVDVSGKIVLPGFLDAHIHLESSLVSPSEFVKAVLPHGTTLSLRTLTRSPTSWVLTASNICCRPQRGSRWTSASCSPPVCQLLRWTNPALFWITGPLILSTTIPGYKVWLK